MNDDAGIANRPGVFAGLCYRAAVRCCMDFSGCGRTIFTVGLTRNVAFCATAQFVAFSVVMDARISLLLHSSPGPYVMVTVTRLLTA